MVSEGFQVLGDIPIVQLGLLVILIYILHLGIRTLKAWLRVWEISALAKEKQILDRGGKELKFEVEKRLGLNLADQIEKSLGKEKKIEDLKLDFK